MRRHRPSSLALLLLLFAAFGSQQWALLTHWHAEVAVQSGALSPANDDGALTEHDCFFCHAASHLGSAAPPAVQLGLVAVVDHHYVPFHAGIEAGIRAAPAHAWQSRGPPAA